MHGKAPHSAVRDAIVTMQQYAQFLSTRQTKDRGGGGRTYSNTTPHHSNRVHDY